jgi:hypothetical protein
MKRAWAAAAGIMICVLLTLLFGACSNSRNVQTNLHEEAVHISPGVTPQSTAIPPLSITRNVISNDEGVMLYPHIEGENADRINASIQENISTCVRESDVQVFTTYMITNNSNGILSAVLEVKDLDTSEPIGLISLNYDVTTGNKLSIADNFDTENDKWRRVLPDIVTLQAQNKGLTLLCEVMPMEDRQLYYISGNELVLLYRQYEITTYTDPAPQFAIPVSELKEFLPEGSPLTRLIGAKPTKSELVEPTPQDTLFAQDAVVETTPTVQGVKGK